MLSAVCVGTNDLAAAGDFYDAVLATIGMTRLVSGQHELGYSAGDGHVSLWVVVPFNEQAATYGNGTQVIFVANDKESVNAFYATAIRMSGTDEGLPGPRDYREGYYGAYVRDLDGNKLHVAIR